MDHAEGKGTKTIVKRLRLSKYMSSLNANPGFSENVQSDYSLRVRQDFVNVQFPLDA